jgi:RHS repeat-associated protein
MVEATVNSVTTTFAYRGDGLRDSRTGGMSTTTFTWDINAGLPVVLDDGSQYLYGAGLSAMKQSGNWFYYLADGLGSTMAIVDADGHVENGYTYDVYGEPTVTGSLANEFDFAGQQTDPTGLQYLRARYYDPATGVFLSREPLERLPGWMGNPFGYAGGNAVSRTDPTGLIPMEGCEPSCQVSAGPPGWFAPEGRWFERRGDDYYLCGMPDARIYNPAQPYCDKFDPSKVAASESPACYVCDVLLAGAGTWVPTLGEYATTRAQAQWKAQRWNQTKLDEVIRRGEHWQDRDGNDIWLQNLGGGKYTWASREAGGGPWQSFQTKTGQRQVDLATESYGWTRVD